MSLSIEATIRSLIAEEVAAAEQRIRESLSLQEINRTLDVAEVSDLLGVSEKLIYRMCQDKSIPHERFGTNGSRKPVIKFRLADIEAWRAEQKARNFACNT